MESPTYLSAPKDLMKNGRPPCAPNIQLRDPQAGSRIGQGGPETFHIREKISKSVFLHLVARALKKYTFLLINKTNNTLKCPHTTPPPPPDTPS